MLPLGGGGSIFEEQSLRGHSRRGAASGRGRGLWRRVWPLGEGVVSGGGCGLWARA